MIDPLEAVRDELQAGGYSPQTLVLLYNAALDAEQRHDLATLEQACRLAEQLAACIDQSLAPEAERLLTLCTESIERVRKSSSGAPATIACPGCGREIPADAVRCRGCGTLLV
jgi:hypothetical protein